MFFNTFHQLQWIVEAPSHKTAKMPNVFLKQNQGTQAAQRLFSPGPGGRPTVFSVKGFLHYTHSPAGFDYTIQGNIRHLLRKGRYIDKVNDVPHIIVAKNQTFMFRTMLFYQDFREHRQFLEMVAADIGWALGMVEDAVRILTAARARFIKQMGKAKPPDTDPIEYILCRLVDKWTELPRASNKPEMTTDQIQEIRRQWRDTIKSGADVLGVSRRPHMPEKAAVAQEHGSEEIRQKKEIRNRESERKHKENGRRDASSKHGSNPRPASSSSTLRPARLPAAQRSTRRSRSPAARRPISAAKYRERSPLRDISRGKVISKSKSDSDNESEIFVGEYDSIQKKTELRKSILETMRLARAVIESGISTSEQKELFETFKQEVFSHVEVIQGEIEEA
jgi:hypothetical protein